jgi:hypothetical protein
MGGRVRFGDGWNSSNVTAARRVVARYPVGQAVQVYYNPANPEEATLEAGSSGDAWISIAFGGIFAAVGVLALAFMPRMFELMGGEEPPTAGE